MFWLNNDKYKQELLFSAAMGSQDFTVKICTHEKVSVVTLEGGFHREITVKFFMVQPEIDKNMIFCVVFHENLSIVLRNKGLSLNKHLHLSKRVEMKPASLK